MIRLPRRTDHQAGDGMSTPRTITTTDELMALDPDTALTFYGWEGATIWDARYIQSRVDEEDYSPDLPAVIVATAEQVRQAREAIEAAREEWEDAQ